MNTIEKLKILIEEGLHPDNLRNLIRHCNDNFFQSPLLYFILISIFINLDTIFEDTETYQALFGKVKANLPALLLEGINNPSLPSLEHLVREYWKLLE